MGTGYDDFTPRAAHDYRDLPPDVLANRTMLREIMERHGFDAFRSEWWHYDFRGWEKFELLDLPFERLASNIGRPTSGASQNRVTIDSEPTL